MSRREARRHDTLHRRCCDTDIMAVPAGGRCPAADIRNTATGPGTAGEPGELA